MASRNELKFAYRLAFILLVVGIFSYAAFPVRTPEVPLRLVYKAAAGKVLFDHKHHYNDTGYGVACLDCHHHGAEEGDVDMMACGACHGRPGQEKMVKATCSECHEPEYYEDADLVTRADAFHGQCIDCHKEFGKGPEACAACHVL